MLLREKPRVLLTEELMQVALLLHQLRHRALEELDSTLSWSCCKRRNKRLT